MRTTFVLEVNAALNSSIDRFHTCLPGFMGSAMSRSGTYLHTPPAICTCAE